MKKKKKNNWNKGLTKFLCRLIRFINGPAYGEGWLDLPIERRLMASSNAIHRMA